jgi:ABC-type antimicrobial peptide transport system permease subunit
VDGDYFGVMKIPLQEGRVFNDADRDSMPAVAIVNRSFVRQYLTGRHALGARIVRGSNLPATIVGVVPDVRDGGQAENIGAMVYLPFRQSAAGFATFITRSTIPPRDVDKLMREVVRSIDPTQPFDRIAPLDQYLSESLGEDRFKTVLLGSLAALALMLACLGIYGVTSYLMQERAREGAIKLALGASGGRLLREFIRGSAATVTLSAATGVALSVIVRVGLTRWIGDAGTLPVWVYPSVLVLLVVIGTGAAWMPAFRASRTPPGSVLRAG